MRQLKLMSAALFLISPFAANAVPIDYDESTDGDIELSPPLIFDFGANILKGNTSCRFDFGCDSDFFTASVPDGAFLDSIAASLSNASDGNGTLPAWFQVADDSSSWGFSKPTSDGGNFFWLVGQEIDSLEFVGFFGVNPPSSADLPPLSADYTLTFNISRVSVPEPGTLALLGLGLAGMGMTRRRKKV